MSVNDRSFAYAQLGYILIVSAALLIFPGASFLLTLPAMAAVWVIVALCYQATAARNATGWWTLLSATTLLAVGVIANIHFFTEANGATTDHPYLLNFDANANFNSALFLLGHGEIAHAPYALGYPMFIASIFRITGITVVAPIVVNMLMILIAAIVSGTIAVRVTQSNQTRHSVQWIQACAIIMTVSVCYLMNTGCILVKDAGICLSMALIALGLTALTNPPATRKAAFRLWGAFALGLTGVAIFRLHYLMMVFVAIVIVTPWRRGAWDTFRRCAIMIGSTAAVWLLFNYLFIAVWNEYTLGISFQPDILSDSFTSTEYPQHAYHGQLLADYYYSSPWYRLLWLPVNAALLFLIPFPWDFGSYLDFGYTYAYAKIAYPWYAVGGMILFYFVFLWRRSATPLKRLTIAAAILWMIPAYMTAGAVSRYVLPLLPWLIPAAVSVWDQYRSTRRFKIYASCYCALLAVILLVCHHLQHSVIN